MNVTLFKKKYIGFQHDPYIIRWVLFRVPAFGIMLHKICRSDHKRALHDHPWPFVSILLRTGYTEVTPHFVQRHRVGAILVRPARWQHRVVIENGTAWSLVFVGRRSRRWGFWVDGKWCWWRQYNPDLAICSEAILHTDGDD